MSFWKKLFGGTTPAKTETPKTGTAPTSHKATAPSPVQASSNHRERDNVGTRYETGDDVKAYSMSRDMQGLNIPFIYYGFYVGPRDGKADAIAAMTELPCFHVATDSGKLISTEVLDFGVYPVYCSDGSGTITSWKAFLSGKNITLELFEAAIASFNKHHGNSVRVSDPPAPKPKPAAQPTSGSASSVQFDREEHQTMNGLPITKRYYNGPSKSAAIAFLQEHPVDKPLFFIEVFTPEGRFGRDIDGIYD